MVFAIKERDVRCPEFLRFWAPVPNPARDLRKHRHCSRSFEQRMGNCSPVFECGGVVANKYQVSPCFMTEGSCVPTTSPSTARARGSLSAVLGRLHSGTRNAKATKEIFKVWMRRKAMKHQPLWT